MTAPKWLIFREPLDAHGVHLGAHGRNDSARVQRSRIFDEMKINFEEGKRRQVDPDLLYR